MLDDCFLELQSKCYKRTAASSTHVKNKTIDDYSKHISNFGRFNYFIHMIIASIHIRFTI